MMDLLLDTHVAIWWMEGSDRLGSRCKATLFRPGARLWISTASVWEMAIKSGLGRLKLSTPLDECIPDLFARGALCLPISLNHALAVRTLPPHPAEGSRQLPADPVQGADEGRPGDPAGAPRAVRRQHASRGHLGRGLVTDEPGLPAAPRPPGRPGARP